MSRTESERGIVSCSPAGAGAWVFECVVVCAPRGVVLGGQKRGGHCSLSLFIFLLYLFSSSY